MQLGMGLQYVDVGTSGGVVLSAMWHAFGEHVERPAGLR